MRYMNRKTGLEIDLGELSPEKSRFFETAQKQFRKNVNWFEFEQVVFSYTSPVFSKSKSRAQVANDPLYLALKDMWLQLGINQGFVSAGGSSDERQEEARTARAYRTARVRDVAPTRKSSVSRRRGR